MMIQRALDKGRLAAWETASVEERDMCMHLPQSELIDALERGQEGVGQLLDYILDTKPGLYSMPPPRATAGTTRSTSASSRTSGRPPAAGTECRTTVHPSAVTMPEIHETPIVMVAWARASLR